MAKKPENSLVLRNDVYQANPLMQARKEFDTLGMRIFFLGLRGVNPHFSLKDKEYDKDFPDMFVPTSKLVELFGGDTWYLSALEKVCDRLFDAKIHLRYEDGGFTIIHIFQKLEYKPAEGLYLKFDELMRPYLLDLFEAKGYTKISVEQIFFLTSPYATRLVELMLQYQNIPEYKVNREIVREINLAELKFSLNVPDDAYDGRMDNFRKFVLDIPIEEINKKTVYRMSYKVIKQGGKVTGFEFHMDISAVPPDDMPLVYGEEAIKKLRSLGFNQTAAEEIFAQCKGTADCFTRVDRALQILQRQKNRNTTPIENEIGFLRRAILEGWTETPRKRAKKPKESAAKAKEKPVKPKEIFAENQRKKGVVATQAEEPPLKRELPASQVMLVQAFLEDKKLAKGVPQLLKSAGWTLKEFKEKYCG